MQTLVLRIRHAFFDSKFRELFKFHGLKNMQIANKVSVTEDVHIKCRQKDRIQPREILSA